MKPMQMSKVSPVWEEVSEMIAGGLSGVSVTVAAVRGSVPTEAGSKMLVGSGGLLEGTVGGGKVEAQAVAKAQEMIETGEACELVTWNLQRDVGMTCGGEMTLLFEVVGGNRGWHVVVFGAGHVSRALVKLLTTLDCGVDVVDEREEWLQGIPRTGNVKVHLVNQFEEGVNLVEDDSYVLSITKGHSADRPVLRELLKREKSLPYLGVIGSASKRAVLSRELKEDGIPEEKLNALVCPLGLPIGNNQPAEIAVSIVAQLLEVRG